MARALHRVRHPEPDWCHVDLFAALRGASVLRIYDTADRWECRASVPSSPSGLLDCKGSACQRGSEGVAFEPDSAVPEGKRNAPNFNHPVSPRVWLTCGEQPKIGAE
eukprot:1196313-Prorocentrum_minimum.AAC.6